MTANGETQRWRLTSFAAADAPPAAALSLGFEDRRRSRQLARLYDGREVGLDLPRGTVLRDGDRLHGEGVPVVVVRAAPETLSVARTSDAWHRTNDVWILRDDGSRRARTTDSSRPGYLPACR